ncbi:MAG: DUF861 domain-containing protein [Armatimonadetes bacterium]|nr:DUF861 domain-containing protein [Armatimonadota bacterium]
MFPLSVTTGRLPTGEMPEMPVEPHEILEGEPNARGLIVGRSADKTAAAGFWSCNPGRYEFLFDYDEFLYLLEGEVTVTESGPRGRSMTLKDGDTACFPMGIKTTWHIHRKLTKYFVARSLSPMEL